MIQPVVRRFWPVGLALAGAFGMLVLGDMPKSVDRGQRDEVDWVLPVGMVARPDSSDQAWASRPPWGGGAPQDDSSSSDAGPQANAVGVVEGVLGLQAVFELPGQPLVRLQQGDALPGGGVVSRVSPRQIDWTTPGGEPRSRTLMVDPLPEAQGTNPGGASTAPAQNPVLPRSSESR